MTVAHGLAVSASGGARTWTVVDESYQAVNPVEEWLETHRHLWSPNTVRSYATSLAEWWTFLERGGEAARRQARRRSCGLCWRGPRPRAAALARTLTVTERCRAAQAAR
jgi:hypothetical protein